MKKKVFGVVFYILLLYLIFYFIRDIKITMNKMIYPTLQITIVNILVVFLGIYTERTKFYRILKGKINRRPIFSVFLILLLITSFIPPHYLIMLDINSYILGPLAYFETNYLITITSTILLLHDLSKE